MVGLRDTTGSSAFALAEYIDALVAAEELDEEESLRYVGPVDHEALKELFEIARNERDSILRDRPLIPEEELGELVWHEIDSHLSPE